MSEYIFIFDLDSTVTAEEILPKVAELVGKKEEMVELTENTMQGVIPFKESFLSRVKLLSDTSISFVQEEIANIKLNENVVEFIRQNKERCYILTGNLDVWICKLMDKIGLNNHYFCSKATKENDRIKNVVSVVDKKNIISQFINPLVVIGDGNNDAEMIDMANIGIGFGGVRNIAPAVLDTCNYATYSETQLVKFLNELL